MKLKEATLAGIGSGLFFGALHFFTAGPLAALFLGGFFGVTLGVLLYKFANSQTVKEQTSMPRSLLLPGEQVLFSKPANLVIRPQDFGLQKFAADGLLWLVGMKSKESLGGALHLTNYRLLFKTHRYNRLRGVTSIFLPTVERIENHTTWRIFRKLQVATGKAKVTFVVGEVDSVISQIAVAHEQLDATLLKTIQEQAREFPKKCCDELEPWRAFNRLNNLLNFGEKTKAAAGAVVNPLGAIGTLFMGELFDKTVADGWQRVFEPTKKQEEKSLERRAA